MFIIIIIISINMNELNKNIILFSLLILVKRKYFNHQITLMLYKYCIKIILNKFCVCMYMIV